MINLHVLYADDESDTREIIGAALGRDPFFISRGCASGHEALATAVAWRPDLTLLDVMMPGKDGLTVLAELRGDTRTAPIPVVLVTARTQPRDREDFKARGAAGVIAKPFDSFNLAQEVRRFVPFAGSLSSAREQFLQRLAADADTLSACRGGLAQPAQSEAALTRIVAIAHALAGAGGIYGFAGIGCESAALCAAAKADLAGRIQRIEVEHSLDRLLKRINPNRR